MLSPKEIFRYKVALIKDAQKHGYLVKGTRAYMLNKLGKTVAIMTMGTYARQTLAKFQVRNGLKPTGILDAPTRAKLIPVLKPTGPVRGIDVSDFQPTISYSAVRNAGYGFLVAKATEGHTFEAHTYARHRLGAAAAGLVFGAYHFARPTSTPGDGRAQAQKFLMVAKPRKGDLFPVLDLEVNDGVGQAALQRWTREFVDEVKRQCGGCIIYTGPYFWNDHVHSTSFGDCPLWVAHYTTGKPMIPMSWDSFSLWQFTSSGSIPGMTNRFDLDISASSGIDHLLIP